MRWAAIVPLLLFLGLCTVFMLRMANERPTNEIPSALLGKPAPELALAPLETVDTPQLSSDVFNQRKVVILNVWASHCAPCRVEHPQIKAMSEIDGVIVAGLNHKDDPHNAKRFLDMLGNPFDLLGADPDGRVSLHYGVYGLPETFIIDKSGIIRKKYVGAITAETLEDEILPFVANLIATP